MKKSVLVIAGEISGDMHAAHVVEALRKKNPDIHFWGIGGDRLREQGVEILYDVKDMAVLGLYEVLKRYSFFKKVFHDVIQKAAERKPDAVLLVDYPGFNLRFAAEMKKRGINVIYYVCPQVWAWHRSRIPKMAKIIDRLIVIFPFEVDVFTGTGLRVDYVGHPLVDETKKSLAEPLQKLPWKSERRVALLPGSRKQEVERILPSMVETAGLLRAKDPQVSFIIAAASGEMARLARSISGDYEIVTGSTRQILRQATAAMVASGTATVETALMGCPMIVVYKTNPMTYAIGKRLIRVPYLGMVNIIANKELCPEFLQHDAKAENMARTLEPLLRDSTEQRAMRQGLEAVRTALGGGGAAERAAEILASELA